MRFADEGIRAIPAGHHPAVQEDVFAAEVGPPSVEDPLDLVEERGRYDALMCAGVLPGVNGQVGEELPDDGVTSGGRAVFHGVDDGEGERRIGFAFADGWQHLHLRILEFQFRRVVLAQFVAGLDAVAAPDGSVLHEGGNGVLVVLGHEVDTGSDQETRAQFVG